jgi:hypothetical protein
MIEYEHYGDLLNTHPDYFLMKRAYEKNLLIKELQTQNHFPNFVNPRSENTSILLQKQKLKENEKNILRCSVGSM